MVLVLVLVLVRYKYNARSGRLAVLISGRYNHQVDDYTKDANSSRPPVGLYIFFVCRYGFSQRARIVGRVSVGPVHFKFWVLFDHIVK